MTVLGSRLCAGCAQPLCVKVVYIPMLVDSHCHLDRLNLSGHNHCLADVLSAAQGRGVGCFLCVGISQQNKDAVLAIADAFPQVVASVGTHPSDVNAQVVSVETLLQWAQHPRVVALGETGLDYHYTRDTAAIQQESFKNHLLAAGHLQLPVIVHTREAKADTLQLIRDYGNTQSAGVLHCFTEDWDMAKAALDLNYRISISGIVTFRNAEALRDVVKKIPMDRLLVETDAPYLAPIPYRGKPNVPEYVREVAEFIAELKGMPYPAFAEQTTQNFFQLFPKARALTAIAEAV